MNFQQWKAFCLQMSQQSPLQALDVIPQRYKNIQHLLQIFFTRDVPVTLFLPVPVTAGIVTNTGRYQYFGPRPSFN
jgi:hypothetical protein